MKKLLSILFITLTTSVFCQTNFVKGFNNGYKKGYCHNQGVGCIAPNPPIAPIPKSDENSHSYNDGYNRGFEMGLEAKEPQSNNNTNSLNRTRYKTSNSDFSTDFVYQPPTDIMLKALNAKQKKYEKNRAYSDALKNWISELREAITEEKYNKELNTQFLYLKFGVKTTDSELNEVENDVKKIISEYKLWISKNNNHNSNSNTKAKSNGYLNSGLIYYKKGEYDNAIEDFTKYLEYDKNNADVLFYRAMAKSEISDYYGALSDYSKILDIDNEHPMKYNSLATIYNNKAYILVKQRKYKEALSLVNEAIELEKSEWYIWDTRAEIYFKTDEYEKAIIDATKAIQIKENSNSLFIRGLANIKLNEKELGCKDLSRAGELGKKEAYNEIKKYCN